MGFDKFKKFRRHYSDSALHRKVGQLSGSFREAVIILFCLLRDPKTPTWAKLLATGVLGYVICPMDLIPDPLPFGLSDDLAAVTSLLISIQHLITDEHRQRAKSRHP